MLRSLRVFLLRRASPHFFRRLSTPFLYFCNKNQQPSLRLLIFPFALLLSLYLSDIARAGGDFVLRAARRLALPFQFPPPRRGRLDPLRVRGAVGRVSIPAPAQGATLPHRADRLPVIRFQFPPPRRGRPAPEPVHRANFLVSIPAPAQGATTPAAVARVGAAVSIPAPAQGATGGG